MHLSWAFVIGSSKTHLITGGNRASLSLAFLISRILYKICEHQGDAINIRDTSGRGDVCCYDWLTSAYIIHTVIHQFSMQNSEQMILMSWFFYWTSQKFINRTSSQEGLHICMNKLFLWAGSFIESVKRIYWFIKRISSQESFFVFTNKLFLIYEFILNESVKKDSLIHSQNQLKGVTCLKVWLSKLLL